MSSSSTAARRLVHLFTFTLACAALVACDDGDDPVDPVADMGVVSGIAVAPTDGQTIAVGATATYTISGLDDAQAYRITLVVADNVTVSGSSGTFVDGDDNGAADAGPSETIAQITAVNGEAVDPGAKTVPGGMDDPANPSGVNPVNGEITLVVTGIAAGSVHPVAYVNGGDSTFLEIDDAGTPIEPHAVGGQLTVQADVAGAPSIAPGAQTIATSETVDYTITGLDDAQAYRITLVVADNVTAPGDGTGTFIDNDMNGAADAGPSETVALITAVNGMPMNPGAKTVPGGMDDPASPSGVFPTGGQITLTITGVGGGVIHPVVYANGGASTFLEIGDDGAPIELYSVGGALTVQQGGLPVMGGGDIAVGETSEYVISGLTDTAAYRVTLVHGDNITPQPGGTGMFIDNDMNGAADAGPSETVGLITMVNGMAMDPGAKTVPGGMDDPASPSGVFPVDGQITIVVTGVGAGTLHPVAYSNGGVSTFLEIDDDGAPIEVYGVGPALNVAAAPAPIVDPADDAFISVGGAQDYVITGLDDAQAYRITLVAAENINAPGDGTGTFIDNDMNGAADAGPSQNTALITRVNGMDTMPGAKTVPGGDDDPASPSGVFPMGGQITLTVSGVGAGKVFPVVYHNGGTSTFLEIGGDGAPIETYAVGGGLTVNGPDVQPVDARMAAIGETADYTIGGLTDGQAYRITLVVGANVNVAPNRSATFVDGDMNGAADAGPSETVALITTVNGMAVDPGAKTVPSPMDFPNDPSGIFPTDGMITLTVTGTGAGVIHPVAYTNAGESTFLEIDGDGAPIEPYGVGGPLTITE